MRSTSSVLVLALALGLSAVGLGAEPGLRDIPAGTYRPLVRLAGEPETVTTAPFRLQQRPVTNGEFLAFVRAHPRWRRSAVGRLFADGSYLQHWDDDLVPGPRAPLDAPVVNVSWFAARAYARAQGWRLPTAAEWERAAQAGYQAEQGRDEPEFVRDLYAWLARPTPSVLPSVTGARANRFGVQGLHGLVWEWVEDFGTAMVTGESRADSTLEKDLFCGGAAAGSRDTADYAAFMRLALRSSLKANNTTSSLGFRCATDGISAIP